MTENNFSLKEEIIGLRDQQKISNDAHIKMSVTLESIDTQMKKLVTICEDHEVRLQKQENFQGKLMLVWGFAIFIMTTIANKVLASINL